MKALKLILVFLLILGGVVGSFFLMTKNDGPVITTVSTDTYEIYRAQFEDDWKQKNDWDKDLFQSHCDLIEQLSVEHNTTPLKDLNTTLAVEIIHNKLIAEWGSAGCRKQVIDSYMNAVATVTKADRNAKSNPLVGECYSINAIYRKALTLAYTKIGLKVEFNGNSWNSFEAYSNEIKRRSDEIVNSMTYKTYLRNISAIANSLRSMPNKVSTAKDSFYRTLATEIVSYYSNIPTPNRNQNQLNSLRSIRNRYVTEYKENSTLDAFAQRFAMDVNNNEY